MHSGTKSPCKMLNTCWIVKGSSCFFNPFQFHPPPYDPVHWKKGCASNLFERMLLIFRNHPPIKILQQFLFLGVLLRPSKVGRKTLRAFAEWVMLIRNDLLERWFTIFYCSDGISMRVYSRVPYMKSLIDFQDTLFISTFKIISIIPRSPKNFPLKTQMSTCRLNKHLRGLGSARTTRKPWVQADLVFLRFPVFVSNSWSKFGCVFRARNYRSHLTLFGGVLDGSS